jgi:sugar lactone lactonase YvrE
MTRVLAAEIAFPAQCELAEGPVWDAARGLLRWVDLLPGHVHALDPVTGAHTWFEVGDPVGGADLGTLYITTARENFIPADRQAQPHAGDIFACTPGVTGRLPYLFGA